MCWVHITSLQCTRGPWTCRQPAILANRLFRFHVGVGAVFAGALANAAWMSPSILSENSFVLTENEATWFWVSGFGLGFGFPGLSFLSEQAGEEEEMGDEAGAGEEVTLPPLFFAPPAPCTLFPTAQLPSFRILHPLHPTPNRPTAPPNTESRTTRPETGGVCRRGGRGGLARPLGQQQPRVAELARLGRLADVRRRCLPERGGGVHPRAQGPRPLRPRAERGEERGERFRRR